MFLLIMGLLLALAPACMVWWLHRWERPPKKRFKHIHVRLGSAIHGSAHFWEGVPTDAD